MGGRSPTLMSKIECRTGYTQIGNLLTHARKENDRQRVQALIFVGDAMEEKPIDLYAIASELGLPVFLFQEGDDPTANENVSRDRAVDQGRALPLRPRRGA
jgi:hypothetical protein